MAHPSFKHDVNAVNTIIDKYNINNSDAKFESFLDLMSYSVFESPKFVAKKYAGKREYRDMLEDILTEFRKSPIPYDKKAAIAYQYMGQNTPNMHKQNKTKGKLSEAIDKIEGEVEDEISGGSNGGDPLGSYFTGGRHSWVKDLRDRFKKAPKFTEPLKVLEFVNSASEELFEEGRPKDQVGFKYYRRDRDLPFISTKALVLDDDLFYSELAQNRVVVRPPLRSISVKKDLIVLLDDSGSMSPFNKLEILMGFLNLLFEKVIEGNIRMLIAPFELGRDKLFEMTSKEDVERFIDVFKPGAGGNTYLDPILKELGRDIKTGTVDGFTLSQETNILVINDGQDEVSLRESPVPIHCCSLELTNEDLKFLCENSGGEYVALLEEDDYEEEDYYDQDDD
jgi:hypothetical protein